MKYFLIAFGFASLLFLTGCSSFTAPEESHDNKPHEHMTDIDMMADMDSKRSTSSNCSGESNICEGPSCGDLNCANCENQSCENKTNPEANCGCGKDKTESGTPIETKNLQTNLITESDGHEHDHDALNTFEDAPAEVAIDAIARTISINAKRFKFSPNVIRIKKGETVKIKVQNIDMTHNITIPEFKIGNKEEALFTATETGTFKFFCANMCGRDHHDMEGVIIVEE